MKTLCRLLPYVIAGVALQASPIIAQGGGADSFKLPPACEKAAGGNGTMMESGMMQQNMGNHMGAGQSEMMKAMSSMAPPMMQAMAIADVDIAFACSMITHHKGAIAMAKVQVSQGKDAEMKAMAQKMIDDQSKEVEKMTSWVNDHAK
jgi:uncharacterized protein (DUF305 family)